MEAERAKQLHDEIISRMRGIYFVISDIQYRWSMASQLSYFAKKFSDFEQDFEKDRKLILECISDCEIYLIDMVGSSRICDDIGTFYYKFSTLSSLNREYESINREYVGRDEAAVEKLIRDIGVRFATAITEMVDTGRAIRNQLARLARELAMG